MRVSLSLVKISVCVLISLYSSALIVHEIPSPTLSPSPLSSTPYESLSPPSEYPLVHCISMCLVVSCIPSSSVSLPPHSGSESSLSSSPILSFFACTNIVVVLPLYSIHLFSSSFPSLPHSILVVGRIPFIRCAQSLSFSSLSGRQFPSSSTVYY